MIDLAVAAKPGFQRRAVAVLSSPPGGTVVMDGRAVVMLGSNNYLGLANHPAVKKAVSEAVDRYGVGTCINPCFLRTPLHVELVEEIAGHVGVEDAVLFASCSTANAGVLATCVGAGDAIFSDRLNHASIIDGCRLSRADTTVYEYRDVANLKSCLASSPTRGSRLIITDGVFSMEGQIAPLRALLSEARAVGADLVVDDSHATGVVGRGGAGSCSAAGIDPRQVITTGTFSKALGGASGGFVAASRAVAEELRERSRSFIFTTGMSVPDVAASLAALHQLRHYPEHFDRLWEITDLFRKLLRSRGLTIQDADGAITALRVGETRRARAIHARLFELGVYVPVMAYPIVAEGDARLRAQTSAALTKAEVRLAVEAIAEAFEETV